MAPEMLQESVQQAYIPAMDMWAAGVLLHLGVDDALQLLCQSRLAFCFAAYARKSCLRYLLFTGDCPVQPEDMQKMVQGPDSKDIVLKAHWQVSLLQICRFAQQLLRGLASRPLEIRLCGGSTCSIFVSP